MLGLLFDAHLWLLLIQLADSNIVGTEAATNPIVLRNSLLVVLRIHLPVIQKPGLMQKPRATKRSLADCSVNEILLSLNETLKYITPN
jgi:hypothetical protein